MDRVKSTLLRNLERTLADPQSIATGALNTAIAQGDWRLMFLQHDRLEKVTPEDVVRVAKAYFKASNRTVGYYIPDPNPDRTVVPATPDLAVLLKDYKSNVVISRGRGFRSHARQHRSAGGARQAGQRHEAGDAVQEDRQRHGDRHHRAALRRPRTPSRRRTARRSSRARC